MSKDYKEVWCESYDEAVESGKSQIEAGLIADDAVAYYWSRLVDNAMDAIKEVENE